MIGQKYKFVIRVCIHL